MFPSALKLGVKCGVVEPATTVELVRRFKT